MAYTAQEREEYRRHKGRLAYDRQQTAQSIIRAAYYKAHPRSAPAAWDRNGRLYPGRTAPRDGILSCGHPLTFGSSRPWAAVRLDVNGHEYHDHKRCGSWACPVCGPKMANKRADEIKQALMGANALGYQCLFLTFTVPHRKAHSSAYVIKLLDDAYNRMLQSRAIRDLKVKYGFVGQIKCHDYTMGDNGTHAHLHAIYVFDGSVDMFDALAEVNAVFMRVWDRMVFNICGRHISRKHGFDLEPVDLGSPDDPKAEAVARYAAKAISVYMADGDKEKGSKTPYDLLSSTATEEDHAVWLDYYKGQKGRRHITFSRGLKDLLGVRPSPPVPAESAAVAWVDYEAAYFLKDERTRQEFEERAAASVSAALEWLRKGTIRQQREFGNGDYPAVLSSFAENIVSNKCFIDALDARPGEWADVVLEERERQEVDFPRYVDTCRIYWKKGPDNVRMSCLSPGEWEDLLWEEAEDEYARRPPSAPPPSPPDGRPPIRVPRSYYACETAEERDAWLAVHRAEYAARCKERLIANLTARPARPRRAVECPPPSPERPASGLGAALEKAAFYDGFLGSDCPPSPPGPPVPEAFAACSILGAVEEDFGF